MEFRTPSIEDIGQIRKAMEKNTKPGCEMSPGNTVLWAKHYRTQIAFYKGEILFRSERENGGYAYCCNLLDASDPRELFDQIADMAQERQEAFMMYCMLGEEIELIKQWYPDVYQIEYDRDGADYIYDREKLASLAGKKLHGKRNHIHRFEEQYPDWRYEPITDENEEECARMAMRWCMKHCMAENGDLEYEKVDESKLVVYAIRHREQMGMIGGAIRADGNIIAITLGEPLTADTFVVHFEKAYSDIQGAYPIINREFVRNALQAYQYVNREEDMGLPGLRKAKLSYYPEILLEKGTITRKDGR